MDIEKKTPGIIEETGPSPERMRELADVGEGADLADPDHIEMMRIIIEQKPLEC